MNSNDHIASSYVNDLKYLRTSQTPLFKDLREPYFVPSSYFEYSKDRVMRQNTKTSGGEPSNANETTRNTYYKLSQSNKNGDYAQ